LTSRPFAGVDVYRVVEVRRLVVLGEHLRYQLAPAGDADLVQDGLDVVADGVAGEEQTGGDLGGARPLGDQ
jgi:hypothetical protein